MQYDNRTIARFTRQAVDGPPRRSFTAYTSLDMIVSSRRLDEFEAQYQREAFATLSYGDALARFAALWAEARIIRPDLGQDWQEDVEADVAVARAVNGLPPAS